MTKLPSDDDKAFGDFLRGHDLVAPLSTAALSALEARIMAKAAEQPRASLLVSVPAGLGWLPGMAEQARPLRNAGLLAILVLMLGFAVGQNLGTASSPSENTDSQAVLFASAAGTPWQSFITTASSGESDDTTDDSGE